MKCRPQAREVFHIDAAKRDHRPAGAAGKGNCAKGAKRSRSGVRAGRKDRGQEDDICSGAPRRRDFRKVVRGPAPDSLAPGHVASMLSVFPSSELLGTRADEDELSSPCNGRKAGEHRPSRCRVSGMVPEYDSASGRQLPDSAPQSVAYALVGHQPLPGDRDGLAAEHRRAYSSHHARLRSK